MPPPSPIAPEPPLPRTPPEPPAVPGPAGDSLAILQALERGEIDVEEASRRLEALDADQPEPAA